MNSQRARRTRAILASVSVAAMAAVTSAWGGPAGAQAPRTVGTGTVSPNECFGPYVVSGTLDRRTYFVGPHNTLEQTYWNGSQWLNQTIPGNPASDTVAAIVGMGTASQQYVFFVGANNTLHQTYWNGARWQDQTLPGTPETASSLAAVSCISPGGFAEDVFFVSPTGHLEQTSYNGSTWQTQQLPGAVASGSSLTASWYGKEMNLGYQANLHVFFRGSAGALAQTYWNGTAWASQSLPGAPEAQSGLTSESINNAAGTSNQHVFYVTSGGALEQTYWNGATWRDQLLPGGPAEASTSLAVNGEHVFYAGAASVGSPLMQTYWNLNAGWRAQRLPGGVKAQGITASGYIDNLAEDALGQQVFYTSGTNVEQSTWVSGAWHSQTLPGKAAG